MAHRELLSFFVSKRDDHFCHEGSRGPEMWIGHLIGFDTPFQFQWLLSRQEYRITMLLHSRPKYTIGRILQMTGRGSKKAETGGQRIVS